jgi:hypothetical protein
MGRRVANYGKKPAVIVSESGSDPGAIILIRHRNPRALGTYRWSSHKRDPAFAHKHPGARLIGVAWCLDIIAWSLLIALLDARRD